MVKWLHYYRIGLIGPLLRYRLRRPFGPAYAAWTPRGWEITSNTGTA